MRVGLNRFGNAGLPAVVERDALLPRGHAEHRDDFGQELVRRAGDGLDLQLAGFDLGNVEHVVQQLQQVLAAGADGFEEVGPFLFVAAVGAADQQLGEAEDAVERRADFVAHVGEELALGAVGGFGQLLGAVQFLRVHFDARGVAGERVHLGDAHADRKQQEHVDHQQPEGMLHPAVGAGRGDAKHTLRPPDAAGEMVEGDDDREGNQHAPVAIGGQKCQGAEDSRNGSRCGRP